MKSGLFFCARFLALCLWHFMSVAIAALVVGNVVSLVDQGQPSAGFASLFAISILETAVVVWMITRSNLSGIRLLVVTLVVFHGVKIFLMMIELAFFLNIWASPPMISLERVLALEVHGLLMACLFCPVAIATFKKRTSPGPIQPTIFPLFHSSLMIKLLNVSVLYAVCYWMTGSFLLIPLAGKSFDFTYGNLQVPSWMPLFQMGRGVLWALVVFLLVRHLRVHGIRLYVGIGVTLAILGGAQLLMPNPYMLDHLRYVHLLEILVSMLIFGGLAGWILRKERWLP